jgi:hypothetical protein
MIDGHLALLMEDPLHCGGDSWLEDTWPLEA